MKIAVLGTRGFPDVQGGVEKHCEELCPRLVKLGCDVTVITRTPYIPKENRLSRWKKVKFIHLWCPKQKSLETIIHTILGSIICVFKRPNIVHIHNIGPSLAIPLLKLARIKTVLTYHSINYEHQKWGRFARIMLRLGEFYGIKFADKVIVISKTTKSLIENKYDRKDLKLIPNGVNLPSIISPGDTLLRYNLKQSQYIFTAARFVPEKGLHDLITAYERIENPEYKLVIAGDADHDTEYSRKIKKSVSELKGVVLTGFLSGNPLQELYSNAGFFVLPSYYEGLPISLLEAMSYGLPVLVSNIPQNREIPLPDFRYFTVGNVNELSKRIVELFKQGISEEEKQKHWKLIKENYSWDRIAIETFEVYKSVVNPA